MVDDAEVSRVLVVCAGTFPVDDFDVGAVAVVVGKNALREAVRTSTFGCAAVEDIVVEEDEEESKATVVFVLVDEVFTIIVCREENGSDADVCFVDIVLAVVDGITIIFGGFVAEVLDAAVGFNLVIAATSALDVVAAFDILTRASDGAVGSDFSGSESA